MKKWLTIIALLLLVGAVLYYYRRESGPQIVRVAQVKRGDVVKYIKSTGRIEPNDQVVVYSPENAMIHEILVEDWQFIKKDQELLKFDIRDIRHAVITSKLNLEHAGIALEEAEKKLRISLRENLASKLEHYQEALDNKIEIERDTVSHEKFNEVSPKPPGIVKYKEKALIIAESQLARAREKLKEAAQAYENHNTIDEIGMLKLNCESASIKKRLAEEELKLAISRMDRCRITSSINGNILLGDLKKGMFVTAGQSLLSVIDTSKLRVRAEIDELAIGSLQKGQRVEVTFEAYSDRIFNGHVFKVGNRAMIKDNRTVVEVIILLDEGNNVLKIANQVDIKIIIDKKVGVLCVPIFAIHQEDRQPFVWLYSNGAVRIRRVTTGLMAVEYEIIDGLNEGDSVVVSRESRLNDGDKVVVGMGGGE